MKPKQNFIKLIEWSDRQFSHLPWRVQRSLYTTLVSEIMLQQTTVATVCRYFEKFICSFPDIESLAATSEEKLLNAWKGLGYYRRARSLKKAATYFSQQCQGRIPLEYEALVQVPGIGEYTANALLAIGNDQKALALDANLIRVLRRFWGVSESAAVAQKKVIMQKMDQFSAADFSFRALNEALMDLGRTYCQARRTSCQQCPLMDNCLDYHSGRIGNELKSLDSAKSGESLVMNLLRVVVRKNHKVLVYKKKKGEWLEGQYEVPTFLLSCQDSSCIQYPKIDKQIEKQLLIPQKAGVNTSITKYRIKNFILEMSYVDFKKKFGQKEFIFVDGKCPETHLSTASLKVLKTAE